MCKYHRILYVLICIFSVQQAFSFVEKEAFRLLLRYCRPSLKNEDIPKRTNITEKVYSRYEDYKTSLKDSLVGCEGRVSFTFDCGTSRASTPFLAVTAHWIDANFVLHEQPIAFRKVVGSHTGENIAKILKEVFQDFGIFSPQKVSFFYSIKLPTYFLIYILAWLGHIG